MQRYNDLNPQSEPEQSSSSSRTVTLGKLAGKFFKCWHRQMSWPFTIDGETYRVCMYCGARRRFIPESWKTVGSYYRGSVPDAAVPTQAAGVQAVGAMMKGIGGWPAGSSRSLYLRGSTRLRSLLNSFVALFESRRSQVRQ